MPIFVHTSESTKYILCTLSKSMQLQQPLKVVINAGESVQFSLNCEKGRVYLTGYFLGDMGGGGCGHDHGEEDSHEHPNEIMSKKDLEAFLRSRGEEEDDDDDSDEDDDEDDDDDDEDDDDEDDDDEEEEENTNGNKRKSNENGKADAKKLKEEIPKLVPVKVSSN